MLLINEETILDTSVYFKDLLEKQRSEKKFGVFLFFSSSMEIRNKIGADIIIHNWIKEELASIIDSIIMLSESKKIIWLKNISSYYVSLIL